MIWIAVTCAVIGTLSCVIFASACVRPALRLRTLVLRLQKHPAMRAASDLQNSSQSIASAAALFGPAAYRLEAAALSIAAAMESVAGYASQVAATAALVESLLGLIVPRLRGMLEKS
jgi:hypothetical protein